MGFPGGSAIKILPVKQETHLDAGSIPKLGRSHAGRHGNPLRILAWRINLMDRRGVCGLQSMELPRVGHICSA